MDYQYFDESSARRQMQVETELIRQQKADGRTITLEKLKFLSLKRDIPEVGEFSFKFYGPRANPDHEDIVNMAGTVIATIPQEWLQDAPSSPDVQARIMAYLEAALIKSRIQHMPRLRPRSE